MNILVFGLNHKTAPIELREQCAFSREEVSRFLTSLAHHPMVHEAVIVSTCNRTEIYSYGVSAAALQQFLLGARTLDVTAEYLLQHCYTFEGAAAAEQLMRVACGLDSLVLGEPEILGQVKAAFALACFHKTVGAELSALFRKTFQVAKRIRTNTSIGACPVSVASTAVNYAKEWLLARAENYSPTILIIGAGDFGRLAAQHARVLTSRPVLIMSRQLFNAQRIAHEVQGVALDITQLTEYLSQVDVVISATASKTLLIHPNMTAHLQQPVLMLDLAVPRDISPEVSANRFIHLCPLDELKNTIQRHVNLREHAALQAEHMIRAEALTFMVSLRTLDSDQMIKCYRARMEQYAEHELQKIAQDPMHTATTISACQGFARNLLNKIMHVPSITVRQASLEGRDQVLQAAVEIFGLSGAED